MSEAQGTSRREIYKTLDLCNFCTRVVGISFTVDLPKNIAVRMRRMLLFCVSQLALILLVIGEIAHVAGLIIKTTSVAELVVCLHLAGYGIMSVFKLLTLWFKRHTFRKLIEEMSEIWPLASENREEEAIKRGSLQSLRLGQLWYMFFNVLGVTMYSVTPIGLHLYRRSRGQPSDMGYVFYVSYPFDKTRSVNHGLVYCFEAYAGSVSVMSMLSSDMVFTTMASHISLLMRVLQVKIRRLAAELAAPARAAPAPDYIDCYPDIVSVIKIHQRLISYSNDIEDTFSLVNLVNVLLSSVNICCVVFVIVLLEPWMDMSSKLFLGAAITQVGILCWYADEIFRASTGVADAVYESGWYRASARARRALLVLLQRSQKPLYFTALKFRSITMTTYTSILTTSYSYFTLLYTVYRSD